MNDLFRPPLTPTVTKFHKMIKRMVVGHPPRRKGQEMEEDAKILTRISPWTMKCRNNTGELKINKQTKKLHKGRCVC